MNSIEKHAPKSIAGTAIERRVHSVGKTRVLAGVLVPDTPVIARSIEYARHHSEPYLFNGPLRFEVEGANVARKFGHGAGFNDRRCQLVWDTVALNSTPSIALYKETEVTLSTAGIALDWGGWGYDSLPLAQVTEIVDVFPRLRMKQQFTQAVCRIVETRPASSPFRE